jgi:hypothetical protein
VLDLPRVFAADAAAGADVWATWPFLPEARLAVLTLRWRKPVRCRVRLAFDLDADRRFLEEIAACGLLTIATSDPAASPEAALAGAITSQVPTADLIAVLGGVAA